VNILADITTRNWERKTFDRTSIYANLQKTWLYVTRLDVNNCPT